MIYDVFYRETQIGVLYVDDTTGKHKYEPLKEGIELYCDKVSFDYEMIHGTNGYVDPIPFFQNRLFQMKRWNLDRINYQTDYFTICRRINRKETMK